MYWVPSLDKYCLRQLCINCAKIIEIEGNTKKDITWISTQTQPLAPCTQDIVLPLDHTVVQIPRLRRVQYVYPTSSEIMNFNPELPPLSCSISINIAPFATTGGCICISISLGTINNLQTWMDTLSSFLITGFPSLTFLTSWVPNFCGPYLGQKCISIYK